jgi:hypothetical protein
MIRLAVFRLGRGRQALRLATAALLATGLAFTSGAPPASAAPADMLLQAPIVGQRFTPADPSGDNGLYDCLPASLTMAISILDQGPADYGSVRQYMRGTSGIGPTVGLGQTYGVVEYSTGGRFTADKTYHSVAPDGWRSLLEGELSQGRPLVLYIADASKLEDSSGQAPRPANESSFPGAHAVLAVGLLNGGTTVVIDDPWNATPGGPGRQLQMTADAFTAACGNTRFSGGAVYSNAGWNYIGFQLAGQPPEPTASPVVQPSAPPVVQPSAPVVTTTVIHRLGPANSTIDFQQPVVSGIAPAAAGAMNATIQAKVDAYIAAVPPAISPGGACDCPGYVNGLYKVGFTSSAVLSIEFDVDSVGYGQNHSLVEAGSLTFTVPDGAQIHLPDLFADQAGGLAVIRRQAHDQVAALAASRGTDMDDPGLLTMSDFDKAWVITPAGLQLAFGEGQIAAYSEGVISVLIPWSALSGFLKADGPAGAFR